MSQSIKTRIKHKHDVEANWLKATNFVPLAGELIVYDVDENNSVPRFKVGDGAKTISELPFSDGNLESVLLENNKKLLEQTAAADELLNSKIDDLKTQTIVDTYDEETNALILEFGTPAQGLIEDTLDSDNDKNALSAKQGKVLNEKINNSITENTTAFSEINNNIVGLNADVTTLFGLVGGVYTQAVPNQANSTKLVIKGVQNEQVFLYVGAGVSGSTHVLVLAPTQSGTLGYKSLGGTELVPVMREDRSIEIPTGNWARGFIVSYDKFTYYSE